ncbi:YraN family protein [Microbacterium sp. M1A1_1b]
MGTAEMGARGEDIAVDWLEQHGFTIVDRNWRCARGEVDIVARHQDGLVFVEVKTRSGAVGGHPLEAITRTKLRRLRHLVPAWFAAHPEHTAGHIRIDAVAVHLIADRAIVEHVEALV